jgi:multidrug efflux pump subunit AcrA (membrane-fusion protein)
MKYFKIIMAGLLFMAVVVSMVGCSSSKNKTTAKSYTYTVARGNINVDIAAAGNLELSTVQDLTFDLFYAKGTVGSVNVTAGDSVTKGEVLASLDTSEWNDQLQLLEDALTAAKRDVTTKQRALTTAQRQVTTLARQVETREDAVTTAERQITSKGLAVQQAQIDLATANNTLNKIAPIKNLQNRIDSLQSTITTATSILAGEFAGGITAVNPVYWLTIKTQAQTELAQAQQEMKDTLNNNVLPTSDEVAIQIAQAELQLLTKQMALEDTQTAVTNAQTAIDDANTAVTNARQDLTFAQQDVANAQSDLNISDLKAANAQDSLSKAQAASPDIKAPLDGFVTKVNVAGGDQVLNGSVILQVADPNKFEADILVSEMDISKVKVGGAATVAVDALSNVTLPARVTRISPTATIQSGVVNYSVRVEVTSTVPITRNLTANIPATSGNTTRQGFGASGNFTPGQGFGASGNFTPPQGFTSSGNSTSPGGFSFSGQERNQTSIAAVSVQLKDGMTVTVAVIVDSRTNVLLVPSVAITTQSGQSYVNVISTSGALEQRAVQTGLTDYQNTEITGGLTEGEKISYTLSTATTSTSSSSETRGGVAIPFIGGR